MNVFYYETFQYSQYLLFCNSKLNVHTEGDIKIECVLLDVLRWFRMGTSINYQTGLICEN